MRGDDATEALLVASRALVGVAATSLADLDDVTLPQFRALVILAGSGEVTATELAERLAIHQSSVTRLCDRLVRKGLVARSQAESDRRVVTLRLTPAGRRLVRRVSDRRRKALAVIVDRMTAGQRAEAVAGMRAFAHAAGEDVGSDLFGWSSP